MTPAKTPAFRLSSIAPDTRPTIVGPAEQPTSPPRASKANRAVPPFGRAAEALLKVPGHMMTMDRPQTAQEARLRRGNGGNQTIELLFLSTDAMMYA